jgi:hypothetical protein
VKKECALIIEYVQEDFVALPDGKCGELKETSSKTKKVKVRSDLLDKGVDDVLNELLSKFKWIKPISEDVKAKLVQLQLRESHKDAARKDTGDVSEIQENPEAAKGSNAAGKLSKSAEGGKHRRREGGKKHHRSRVEKISSAPCYSLDSMNTSCDKRHQRCRRYCCDCACIILSPETLFSTLSLVAFASARRSALLLRSMQAKKCKFCYHRTEVSR